METLKKGSKGESVKTLQKLLGLTADGIFGANTETAVKQFQLKNGLTVDGVVGDKTWSVLQQKGSSNIITSIPIITNKFLNSGQYLTGTYKNEYIVLHHTAGHDSPEQVVDTWNNDSQGRVATEFVIGGIRSTDGRSTYDGKIIRTFPEGCQGYHIGNSGSSYMNTHAVGIENCNIGWVKNGKSYVNTTVQTSQIVTLSKAFRGYTQWHRYSDKQLESLKSLLLYVANRDSIDLHTGIYSWIKSEGVNAFEFHADAYNGKTKGLITHANIRTDKFDMFPQQELIDMILSL
jgi:peptidoglycan hydrolase-like protein with peptidoglycan-binding domain